VTLRRARSLRIRAPLTLRRTMMEIKGIRMATRMGRTTRSKERAV
jgi:hypothetical protein